jgi:hypothetical protein
MGCGERLMLDGGPLSSLWFLPAEAKILSTSRSLRGSIMQVQLSKSVPLRNSVISELVLLVEREGYCRIYLNLTESSDLDPMLELGEAMYFAA